MKGVVQSKSIGRTCQGVVMASSRVRGRCAHKNSNPREHTCPSSLSKSSGHRAPCVGVILHCLTTSSPCFKTERKAISLLRATQVSAVQRCLGTQNSGEGGCVVAKEGESLVYSDKMEQKQRTGCRLLKNVFRWV